MAPFLRSSALPKICDVCQCSTAVVFCRADAAYLCVPCDGKVHGANKLASRHERVWMCEVCELSPAVVSCKADAAALCLQCDADIHSANPLARRHERVPITPFYEFPSMVKVAHIHGASMLSDPSEVFKRGGMGLDLGPSADEDPSAAEAASWILPRPEREISASDNCFAVVPRSPHGIPSQKPTEDNLTQPSASDLFTDVDPYLDLDFAAPLNGPTPPPHTKLKGILQDSISHFSPSSNASSMEPQFASKKYPYPPTMVSQSVSESFAEVQKVLVLSFF